LLLVGLMSLGCASATKTQKGAAVGTVSGGAMGAVIGRASGNTAMGAIIGAAVGGTAGAIIGNKMDKQAEEIRKTVPDVNVERVGEGIVVEFSSNVLFGFDQSDLTSVSKTSLDKLVKVLEVYPDTDIEVQGHTDSRGSTEYNQNLSVKRANSVSNYLNTKNIAKNRIKVVGYGESLPKYDNKTAEGRDQNRRVEFLITANEKMKAEAEKEVKN
jgi:outer membrane protein OmpA-like peptidoglycan-associated protein